MTLSYRLYFYLVPGFQGFEGFERGINDGNKLRNGMK